MSTLKITKTFSSSKAPIPAARDFAKKGEISRGELRSVIRAAAKTSKLKPASKVR